MANRKGKVMENRVKEMYNSKHSIRKISECLRISRNTVRRILSGDKASVGVAEDKLPITPQSTMSTASWASVNWEKVLGDLKKGVTVKQLHAEWAPEGVCYNTFWYRLSRRNVKEPQTTIRLIHKPGEKTFFDFTDGIPITDRITGKVTKTQLLCATLPFSSMMYGEFIMSQKQPDVMKAIENTWIYFGGVTPYATVDNFKGAVTKAHTYDPTINKVFEEFATHWGVAVLATRPRKPKDKAAVESSCGLYQRTFYQEVREKTFYSLEELNQALREYLDRQNKATMKDYGISRQERFEVEKPNLKPLANTRFELFIWKECIVHPDCHIQADKRFYSVPNQYVDNTVYARVKSQIVEIFNSDNELIATHAKPTNSKKIVTDDAHYPEKSLSIQRFDLKKAQTRASQIGPHTKEFVDFLLNISHPLKHLRRIQGIIRLIDSKHVSREGLEHACEEGMRFKKYHYAFIKEAAQVFDITSKRPKDSIPIRDPEQIYLHKEGV